MATRAMIRFATRESGVSFSEHPEKYHAQFYRHYNGNVEDLGQEIVNSLQNSCTVGGLEIDNLSTFHDDADYIYYIWQHVDKDTYISIFKRAEAHCPRCGIVVDDDEVMYECFYVGMPCDLQHTLHNLGSFQTFDQYVSNKCSNPKNVITFPDV
jgi:hypothetical protein